MNIRDVAKTLQINYKPSKNSMKVYESIRENYISNFKKKYRNIFQSPSIEPTTITQRGKFQNTIEHEAYQRADFKPISLEMKINNLFTKRKKYGHKTLVFNSGMGAISTLLFYLKNFLGLEKTLVGENAYFETKWIFDSYSGTNYINEYDLNLPNDWNILWLEYPINCTSPSKYPFDRQLNLDLLEKQIISACKANPKKQFYLVIDYTLYFLPYDTGRLIRAVPHNLHIYLVTSLQKHRGYGFDLTNGGAITFHNTDKKEYNHFLRLRAILGTSFTEESLWLMPKINQKVINKIIIDSGKNAKKIYYEICHLQGDVRIYFSDNTDFLTSFIFIVINPKLIKAKQTKPFLSDLLIASIIKSAKAKNAILVHGTSFGLPYCRLFKNSERYKNTSSLRIAVGYDENMINNVAEAIEEGIKNFLSYVEQDQK